MAGADLADPDQPRDALGLFQYGKRSYDLVVHCAARSPHRAAIDGDPATVGSVNLMMDAAMFRWAQRVQPGRVVYLSSSAAYPVDLQTDAACTVPLREDEIRLRADRIGRPDAVYGWTKLTGELLAEGYRSSGGKVTVVRPFSGYGEDQSNRFPFGAFRDRALARQDPFEVWGDGSQIRDFIHVDDVVGATLALTDRRVAGPVNICTGIDTSMGELAAMFIKMAGYSARLAFDESAPQGVACRVGDSVLMRTVYRPTVTIEEGVERAVREVASHGAR